MHHDITYIIKYASLLNVADIFLFSCFLYFEFWAQLPKCGYAPKIDCIPNGIYIQPYARLWMGNINGSDKGVAQLAGKYSWTTAMITNLISQWKRRTLIRVCKCLCLILNFLRQ